MSDYDPNSYNAVLSRIETKLDNALKTQDEHGEAISKLWRALNRLDVRVAAIAATIGVVCELGKLLFFH